MSGSNVAVSRPSASEGLERPLLHPRYSRTRPFAVLQISLKRLFTEHLVLKAVTLRSGRWLPQPIGQKLPYPPLLRSSQSSNRISPKQTLRLWCERIALVRKLGDFAICAHYEFFIERMLQTQKSQSEQNLHLSAKYVLSTLGAYRKALADHWPPLPLVF